MPDATRVVIPGAGHVANVERPEEFNRVLLDFLARVRAYCLCTEG